MDGTDTLNAVRQQLADAIFPYQPPICAPLTTSPWIAMSALQKAIRRGHEQFALRAAATLLFLSPEQLWRRCGCIAYEDIGVADFETLSLVTAALAGKRFRAQLGGEWAVASFIVARMVHVPKCRAADDLLLSAEHHPSLKAARQLLPDSKVPQLLALTTGSNPIGERALALWYAIGTYRSPSPQLALVRAHTRRQPSTHWLHRGYPSSNWRARASAKSVRFFVPSCPCSQLSDSANPHRSRTTNYHRKS